MRKNRADSISEEVRIVAMGDIKPPAHMELREQEIPFWNGVINARAKTTWNDLDLCFAVYLARCLADIETLTLEIFEEEQTVCSDTGVSKINPKLQLIEMLSRRSIALSRFLHVHIGATNDARDTGRRTRKEKELLDSLPDHDLLAKPIVQ